MAKITADEIRRLAESCKDRANYYKNMTPCSDLERDKWYRDAAKIESDKASALLNYAAMVDRCETQIATVRGRYGVINYMDFEHSLNFIIRGDAGKEER